MKTDEPSTSSVLLEKCTFSIEEVSLFAKVIGDYNPIHLDVAYAREMGFKDCIVHGALLISKISSLLATNFPGPGTVIGRLEWNFLSPICAGELFIIEFKIISEKEKKVELFVGIKDPEMNLKQHGIATVFRKLA